MRAQGLALSLTALVAIGAMPSAQAQTAYDPFAGRQANAGAAVAGDLTSQKEPVDFETVQAGRDRITRAVPLTNEGGTPVKITGIKLAIDDEQMHVQPESCLNQELGAGARCTVAVTWRPSRPGRLANVLMIEHGGRSRSLTIPIKGVAQPPGFAKRPGGDAEDLLVPSPNEVDFGTASLKTSASRAVIVTNIDEQPITITRVDLVGNPQTLRLSDDSCSRQAVEPGRACLVTLLYTPATAADLSINMVVHHTGPRGYLVIPITAKPPAAIPGEPMVASAAAPAGRGTNSTGLPSLIPDNEVDAQGAKLKLIGTSGKVAILDRGGRTQIVTSGQSVTLDGTAYKAAVSQGNLTLTPATGAPIHLDGEEGPKIAATQADADPEKAAPGVAPAATKAAATKPALPPAPVPATVKPKTPGKPTALTPAATDDLPTVTIPAPDRTPTATEALGALQAAPAMTPPGSMTPPAPMTLSAPMQDAPIGAPMAGPVTIPVPARATIVLPDHIPAALPSGAATTPPPGIIPPPPVGVLPPSVAPAVAPALPRPLSSLPQPTQPLQAPAPTKITPSTGSTVAVTPVGEERVNP